MNTTKQLQAVKDQVLKAYADLPNLKVMNVRIVGITYGVDLLDAQDGAEFTALYVLPAPQEEA